MLLDDFFPAFDVSEGHTARIAAPPAAVYSALRTADLSGHVVTRAMLARIGREAERRRRT